MKAEESMKKELQMRLAVAKFMQESLEQMAVKKKSSKAAAGSDQDASGAQEVNAAIKTLFFFSHRFVNTALSMPTNKLPGD